MRPKVFPDIVLALVILIFASQSAAGQRNTVSLAGYELNPVSVQPPTAKIQLGSLQLFLPAVYNGRQLNGPTLAGCPLLPANHVLNARVDQLPLDPRSNDYISSIGANVSLHPDFGSGEWEGGPIGIPFNLVGEDQPLVDVAFGYPDESDPGPYPIPVSPLIEGGAQSEGDRHVLVLDSDACKLYELWNAYPQDNGSWVAGSGAIFDLRSNALRPDGWTSADAAGLAILPGLVRYEEVAAGSIQHAIRFTAQRTQRAYRWPARHYASTITDVKVPPMGQRFRLKDTFNTSDFSPQVRVILEALKVYGLVLADNGSNWYLSGAPHPNWDNDTLVRELKRVHGSDFEAVNVSGLMVNPDSGLAR